MCKYRINLYKILGGAGMSRRLLIFGLICLLLLTLPMVSVAAPKGKAVPPPTPADMDLVGTLGWNDAGGNPGTWYVGATPPNVDYTKPVLLFVHGKGGSAKVWWGDTVYHGTNDMYTQAYNNGYRTAFVDLHPEGTMWQNGALLKQLIDNVTTFFGVSKVTIIAHSKGGVDSNAASVHYGAASKISRVVTLGSPHRGTPLADLAYSSWTWWLAELFGQTSDATYVMQTSYMDYFRSVTDNRDSVPYYTLSGYKCGPVFTALWYGCMAIGGEDDGVVPVWSAEKPGGIHLKTGYWDHDEIRMASRTWSTFFPYIKVAAAPLPAIAEGMELAAAQPPQGQGAAADPAGNLILRGGEVFGEAEGQPFPIESGVRKVTILFYASHPDFAATLTAPDGTTYDLQMTSQIEEGDIFAGAWAGAVEVTKPTAGEWSLTTSAPEQAGYLMVANLDSNLKATLNRGAGHAKPNAKRDLALSLAGAGRVKASQVRAEIGKGGAKHQAGPVFTEAGGIHRAALELTDGPGIYNLTVTMTGTLADGSAFERTVVSSVAVVPEGLQEPWMGD